jgi:hypothetical protein
MSLRQTLDEHIKAVFTGMWIKSFEHNDAIQEIAQLCDDRENKDWQLLRWDVAYHLRGADPLLSLPVVQQADPDLVAQYTPARQAGQQGQPRVNIPPDAVATAPFAEPSQLFDALPTIASQCKALYPHVNVLILVLENFHRMWTSKAAPLYIQKIQQLIKDGKSGFSVKVGDNEGDVSDIYTYIIGISPDIDLPPELQRQITVIDHALPNKDQLWEIIEKVADESEIPSAEERPAVLEAAAGLTRMEAENAVALSLIRSVAEKRKTDPTAQDGVVDPSVIWEVKAQCLKKSGLLELYDGSASFDDMGGIAEFREYSVDLLNSSRNNDNPLLVPKGLMLLGVPGSGKSQAARCLATATNRRLLQMDVGSLMSKYVGDSDKNMREALDIADAMSPCILFIDEVEKGLAGVGEGRVGDSGVSTRMFGQLLGWLNDHTTDVFTICTSNDISKLPPEFSRAERFDGVFFFDMPSAEERQAIWEIYLNMFGHEGADMNKLISGSDNWTGAEIRACCRLAAMRRKPLEDQMGSIVPVATMADTSLDRLRSWASGRCQSVREAGIYYRPNEGKKKAERPTVKKKRRTVAKD